MLRSALLVVVACLCACGAEPRTSAPSAEPEPPRTSEAEPVKVFVHLFEWTWSDVALECESFLGPNGIGAVQVSPPSEHALLAGFPWWQRYQTVSYGLERSRSGDRGEFEAMVARCRSAGVGIYVDAVVNHMTAQTTGTGSAGTVYTKYDYPGLYDETSFHQPHCTIASDDYGSSADNVQRCELLGLADLDTGSDAVRRRIAGYLSELVEIGVAGFRIDAAKHVAPEDLAAIFGLVDEAVPEPAPYYFLEVIDPGGEAVRAADYLDLGLPSSRLGVTEFRYASVSDAFLNRNGHTLAELATLDTEHSSLLPADRAVVFTNNHDTQRASAISYRDGALAQLANVFMLAWPYGYPSLMSSYAFDVSTQGGRDQGPPSDGAGNTRQVYDGAGQAACPVAPEATALGEWACEHRVPSVAQMVRFRAAVEDAPVTKWWDNGMNQIAFARGDQGFVVINRQDIALEQSFDTGLAMGRYCDVLSTALPGECGALLDVDAEGRTTLAVSPLSAVALLKSIP